MIEMNLTDSPAYIVGNYSSGAVKKSVGILLLVFMLVAIPLFSVFLVKMIMDISEEREVVAAETVAAIGARSRARNEAVVEEIIDSVKGFREIPIADKKYEEMARFEQLDFEVKFTALILEDFARDIPSGVTFNELRISGYRNLLAEGTAPDRGTVTALLSKFRTGGWRLLPKPQTNIRDGGNFYHFRIEAQYFPSISTLLQRPINPENIPDIRHLERVKRKVTTIARSSGLKTTGLTLINSINEPREKKFTYSMKLNGNFAEILDFVKAVSQMSEPVRCEEIVLKYRARSIEATATIVIDIR